MGSTQIDLNNLENARMEILHGERIARVTVARKTVDFQHVDLDKIESLITRAKIDLGLVGLRTYAQSEGRG